MIEKFQNLALLAKAIQFQNLTTASQHVGVSQPQLSRIIQGLESATGLVLLDRSVRRKSQWTADAIKLVDLYHQVDHRFTRSLQDMTSNQLSQDLRVACLEGLVDMAIGHLGRLAKVVPWKTLWFDVLDQSELEEKVLADAIDIAWTSRVPGRRKPKFLLQLGWQNLVAKSAGNSRTRIVSSFEYAQLGKDRSKQEGLILVSNSLRARELWLEKNGGSAQFPSKVLRVSEKGHMPVILLGSETMSEQLWQRLRKTIASDN